MFSIWAKQLDDNNRIKKQDMFHFKQEFDGQLLFAYLQIICNEWKIETPVVLTKHIVHFMGFNSVKFRKEDFIDETTFSSLVLEYIED